MPKQNMPFIRTYQPGDAGLIANLHMQIYVEEYGFKGIFEYYLLDGLAQYVKNPAGSQVWVVEAGGRVAGAIAIVKTGPAQAQLRWFILNKGCRGHGLGGKLMDTALAFCAEQGYTHIVLWTVGILHPARHLYEKYGFVPTEEMPNTEWSDAPLTEEKWELHIN